MSWRPIHDDESQLGDGLAQIVKTGDDDFGINCFFKNERVKTMVGSIEGQNVNAITGSRRDFARLADRLPSVRHTRVERETGFIKIVKLKLAGFGQRAKAFQFGLRSLKVYFVAFATQATSEALPRFVAFLENAFECVAADLFAGLFFDLRQASFRGARIFLDDFDRLLLLFFIEGWLASASALILKAI